MEFREMLLQTRKAKGWSQEDLAEKIQISRQAVSKWETGDAMPDLPKLLALADALDISLDALCGREYPAADTASPPVDQTAAAPESLRPANRSRRMWMLLCGLLALCLLATGLWAWSQRNWVPAEHAAAQTVLPDNFTVSGVSFVGESDYRVKYQFTPGVTGEGLTFQITFTTGTKSITMDAPCAGGVCSDTAVLDGGFLGYTVTVTVTDGTNARNLAIAGDLTFSEGSAAWLPLTENT